MAPDAPRPIVKLELTKPQLSFVGSSAPFPCICAGFGAGKTQAAVYRALNQKFAYPAFNVAYYMPTYDLVSQVGFPRFAEVFEHLKILHYPNQGKNWIDIPSCGRIIFRTMDTPKRIIGYEVADSICDELDTLKAEDAEVVWNKIVSRNRQKKPDGKPNTIGVATTPEGFRFVYKRWKKEAKPGYKLIKASTYSNERNLPSGYIQSLIDTYPANQLQGYLHGEFVNLTTGSVYSEFDRHLNGSSEVPRERETLHIGMDFNVTKMAAIVHVLRDNEPHAVDEFVRVFDTPSMIQLITDRYADKGHSIIVYPDASGKSRKSVNASTSDLALLQQAKFRVCANPSNPAVKDRVLAMNALIHKQGKRSYHVNADRCPHLVESLEKQAYDSSGEPDKTTGFDHPNDATGYFVCYRFPVKRPVTTINLGFAQ